MVGEGRESPVSPIPVETSFLWAGSLGTKGPNAFHVRTQHLMSDFVADDVGM